MSISCDDGKTCSQLAQVLGFESSVDRGLLEGENFRNAFCEHVLAASAAFDEQAQSNGARQLAAQLTAALSS